MHSPTFTNSESLKEDRFVPPSGFAGELWGMFSKPTDFDPFWVKEAPKPTDPDNTTSPDSVDLRSAP